MSEVKGRADRVCRGPGGWRFGMPRPYDANTKHLLAARLAEWLPLSGRSVTGLVEPCAQSGGHATAI